MGVQEVGRPVQRHRGLAGARTALYHQHPPQGRPDGCVLFGLDGGDDVTHATGTGLLQARQQGCLAHQPAARPAYLASEKLVVDPHDLPTFHADVAASHHSPAVGAGRPVEGLGHRRPPVDHQWLARLVGDAEPADVQPVPSFGVKPPEAQGPLPTDSAARRARASWTRASRSTRSANEPPRPSPITSSASDDALERSSSRRA